LETSLSIHPEHFEAEQIEPITSPGNVNQVQVLGRSIHFQCQHAEVYVVFYTDSIIRLLHRPTGGALYFESYSVVMKSQPCTIKVEQLEQQTIVYTAKVKAVVKHQPFQISFFDAETGAPIMDEPVDGTGITASGQVRCTKQSSPEERFYGFGEKAGFLNKKGEKLMMWNTDVYAPHNQETNALYVSIPYYIAMNGKRTYGLLFDNTSQTYFDMRHPEYMTFGAEHGDIDYYLLAGPVAKEVLAQYRELTGYAPLPPKWSLGYHQSRYSYQSESEVLQLAETFRSKRIPLDAVYLDIHYMDGYRVFTVDQERFPKFAEMNSSLKEQGIRLVTIVDPGVKQDEGYHVYDEGAKHRYFCEDEQGNSFIGPVWPGDSAFPDFTSKQVRRWWGEKQDWLIQQGVAGIWNDMNEPSVFNESKTMDLHILQAHEGRGARKTHGELHNVYGLTMTKATYEGLIKSLQKRPFVLTRSGYAGIQRYGMVWTGDNRSFWEHLQMLIPMCLNLGLSGVPFCGADVGGFAHDAQGELLVRWTQAAAFTPYFRNHSELKSSRQEPWVFGEKIEAAVREAIELRYRWLPQLYTLAEEASRTGLPIMRPMFLEYPDLAGAESITDQFMFGDNVLVAPILRPDHHSRTVLLPSGGWFDYWTDSYIEGDQVIAASVELQQIPLYIRANSVRFEEPTRQSTAEPAEQIVVHIYVDGQQNKLHYRLYEDDGETFNLNGASDAVQDGAEAATSHTQTREEAETEPTNETTQMEQELGIQPHMYEQPGYQGVTAYEVLGTIELDQQRLTITEQKLQNSYRPTWLTRKFVVHSLVPVQEISVEGTIVSLQQEADGCYYAVIPFEN